MSVHKPTAPSERVKFTPITMVEIGISHIAPSPGNRTAKNICSWLLSGTAGPIDYRLDGDMIIGNPRRRGAPGGVVHTIL